MTQAARPAGERRWPGVLLQAGLSVSFFTTRPTISRAKFLLLSAHLAMVQSPVCPC
jgi:hypothetical protein